MLAYIREFLFAAVYGECRGTSVSGGGACMHLSIFLHTLIKMESLLDILPTFTIMKM